METCIACDLINGTRELPGGRVYSTNYWVVEHCIGPFGLGALIVKPKRHCIHFWELSSDEANELGFLLKKATTVIEEIMKCDQIYICLWSHMNWKPGHIHFVLQPVWNSMKEEYSNSGPFLQIEKGSKEEYPSTEEIDDFVKAAKEIFQEL